MINHHPDTRLLNEYSSGALPLAQSVCVSLHLKYCGQCQRAHQQLMSGDYNGLDWQRISAGLSISRQRTGDVHNEFALYHIRAGASIPQHTHKGTELTLVLEGSFSDEDGNYGQGDFILRDAEQIHTPTASRDGDCICIGVLDAPVKFVDWKYRVLNPFLKLQPH